MSHPTAETLNPNTRYRHEESQNYLSRGVECMLLAEEDQYQDKALLTEACDAFIEAIKYNRQQTEAYVGMAYLLWILGDQQRALQYLEQGLRTNPAHPDVHALIKQITGKPQSAGPVAEQPEPQAYRALQTEIQGLLEKVKSENTATLAASVNPHAVERLQERLQGWESDYEAVLAAIDDLQAFHERVMLTCELGPVQDRIMAYHQALRQSERLTRLDDKILENTRLTRQYLNALEAGETGMFCTYADILLDNCDALADELDVLEREGLNIRTLDSHYQQLIEVVEAFQLAMEGVD
ncbi:MAG: hypothetical protein IGS03_05240 [Candidatus Sericytochromatia bacterium]|nr:hypothetical protein [Candidatus Sericytochromatia bacterium]